MAIDFNKNAPGAMWLKQKNKVDGDGKEYILQYLTGSIEIDNVRHAIVMFRNRKKPKPTSPDFFIYFADNDKPQAAPEPPADDVPF